MQRSIDLYTAVFRHYTGLGWTEVRDRAGTFAEWFDDTDVQLLPEIEGIAEGAGVDAEDVLALNVRTEVMFGLDTRAARAAAKECTSIGAAPPATAGGRVFVAQNWDWKPPARDTCVLLAMRPAGRPAFVTLVEAGLLAKAGMNDGGLGLATNALTSSRDRGEPRRAVPRDPADRVLTSTSLEEAVAEVTVARARVVGELPDRLPSDGQLVEPGGCARKAPTRRGGSTVRSFATRTTSCDPTARSRTSRCSTSRESPLRQARPMETVGSDRIDVAGDRAALRAHAGPDHGERVGLRPQRSVAARRG